MQISFYDNTIYINIITEGLMTEVKNRSNVSKGYDLLTLNVPLIVGV